MRMIRTRISHINVAKWFPANDPIAVSIARLCVLREDLYLELRGMVKEPIPTLDECSDDWRTIYFFRNSVRTLLEIRGAVETLKARKVFTLALGRQPDPLSKTLDDLAGALDKAHALIKKLRNEVAGHLPHEAIEEALRQIAPETKGLLQIGGNAKEIHYKFALEFLGATMLRHVVNKDAEKEWNKILKTTLQLGFKAIRSIDMLFVAYSRVKKLSF